MACLSSSPPPMMPEDDEEEDDSSFAEGFVDLSESDNLPYDLTGRNFNKVYLKQVLRLTEKSQIIGVSEAHFLVFGSRGP